MQGEDLSKLHESQTLNTRRKAIIAATGIDINLERIPLQEFSMPVADIFAADNILPNFPEWVDDYPDVAYRGQALAITDWTNASVLIIMAAKLETKACPAVSRQFADAANRL